MFSERRRSIRRTVAIFTVLVACGPSLLLAQDRERHPVAELLRSVAFDPTTYAPAAIGYDAAMRDWNTSQAFFRNGYLERNPRFTETGLRFDVPVSYETGRRLILRDALVHAQLSAIHNVTSRSLERILMERHPERRTLIRTLGWIQRTAFASYLAYQLSAPHYRQARENERLAREYGFR